MFNKKRWIMMSLATSMMFSSQFIPLSISVLATDMEEEMVESSNTSAISLTQTDLDNSSIFEFQNGLYFLKSGNYKLASSLNLKFPIYIDGNVTIDLQGYSITNETQIRMLYVTGTCTIKGSGKIIDYVTTNSDEVASLTVTSGQLSISNVEIETRGTNCIYAYGETAKLNLTDCSIVAKGEAKGITTPPMPGNVIKGPTINLVNTYMESEDEGISQNFSMSTINLTNCAIVSESRGIDSSVGTLNITNSVIRGDILSASPKLAPIGVLLRPDKDWDFLKVNIENSLIGGNMGLVVADLYDNITSTKNISINVSNTEILGSQCTIGYTSTKIPFTLTNVSLKAGANSDPKKLEVISTSDSGLYRVDSTTPSKVPYTIKTSDELTKVAISTSSVSLGASDVVKDSKVLTSTGQAKVEKNLTAQMPNLAASEQQKNSIALYSNTEKKVVKQNVSYDYGNYKVEIISPQFTTQNNQYEFQVKLTARLNPNSVVGLRLPRTQNELVQTMDEFEIMNETTPASDAYCLNVRLCDVLKNPTNIKSGLSSEKIQTIAQEVKDIAPISTSSLQEFENVDLSEEFVMHDMAEIIELGSIPSTINVTPIPMYRLYNVLTGEHLYTADPSERASLLTSNTWKDEGEAWIAPSISNDPVYRLLNPNTSDHHYTMDKNEYDTLQTYGWKGEGLAFYSAEVKNSSNIVLYRLYNPNATGVGSHHYTMDKNERDTLAQYGWIYEGTAWAGLPTE
ncbi:MAG: hypothetical protein K2H85_03050 [Allobaculum sp.]|nr:hypothetical protein [Allobaculum sp.]